MSGRKLNPLELKIHQAALAESQKTLSQKEFDALSSDVPGRIAALNFLLGTNMMKLLKDSKGNMLYKAVPKQEMQIKKDMTGEESMVLSHIQAAANEGIWTKFLRNKTELHQTVLDRCLKALTQKQLIKVVPDVRHPTRKIFMMSHLEPSVAMTGGPWYTDSELDTEFIRLLSSACLSFIRDRSNPKSKRYEDRDPDAQPIYPISGAPSYPTAVQVQSFLSGSKITETPLTVEHVEMLLKVLVLDGEIEAVPAFGAAMWESNVQANGDDSGDERAAARKKRKADKKRKRDESDDSESEDDLKKKKKPSKKRRKSDSDSEEEETKSSRKKKHHLDETEDDVSDDEKDQRKKDKKKKKKKSYSSDEDDDSDARSKSKKKKGKKSKHASSSDDSSDSDSEDDRRSRSKRRKRSQTPELDLHSGMETFSSAQVYRAIKQERVALGWSQAPCGKCPVFDFCRDKGPVNPAECTYYEPWLNNAAMKMD